MERENVGETGLVEVEVETGEVLISSRGPIMISSTCSIYYYNHDKYTLAYSVDGQSLA